MSESRRCTLNSLGYSRRVAASDPDTLSVTVFRGVVEALETLGIDSSLAMGACGLDQAQLRDPSARVDARLEHRWWDQLEAQTEDPAIGIRVGVVAGRSRSYAVDGYMAYHADSWRTLLDNAQRFARLSDDWGRVELLEYGDIATVRTGRANGTWRAPGYIDALFAALATLSCDHIQGFRFLRVRLRRPAPPALQPYRDALGVVPEFGAPYNEVSFSQAMLDAPNDLANPVLVEILSAHATNLLQALPTTQPLIQQVEAALRLRLGRGEGAMPEVARALGMSARTLHRRLAAFGTTFQQVADGVRRSAACHRLRTTDQTVENLASALGFASTSAFQRAFRRWTGMTPSLFRAGGALLVLLSGTYGG